MNAVRSQPWRDRARALDLARVVRERVGCSLEVRQLVEDPTAKLITISVTVTIGNDRVGTLSLSGSRWLRLGVRDELS